MQPSTRILIISPRTVHGLPLRNSASSAVHRPSVCGIVAALLIAAHDIAAEAPRVEAVALKGEPLGVASARFRIDDPAAAEPGRERFNLAGDHRRILYPVFLPDPVPGGPNGPAGRPEGFEMLFLFSGSEPLEAIVTCNLSTAMYKEYHAPIVPTSPPDSSAYRALLARWWKGYRAILAAAETRDEAYPVIENYLRWHLPRSLDLEENPELGRARPGRPLSLFPEVEGLADLLAGTESIRIAFQRDTLLGSKGEDGAPPSEPLPEPPAIRPVEIPAAPLETAVEPLARFVPAECLYVWFPRFRDFQEIRGRAESWGGGLHDAILGRSFDAGVREILQTQLALRETVLATLFGDLAIGEMAIVAFDTFVREGSALGFVFEARNETTFTAAIRRLRSEAVEASRARPEGPAEEEEIQVGGERVKFLRAPGNRIRSFHASMGKYHLVANCRKLVERFLECGKTGRNALLLDPGFRHARVLHPLGTPQSALAFVSDPFLRELVGPAYRAEMTRRTRARADLELVEIARAVARAETGQKLRIEDLIGHGYLPGRTIIRPDGSRPVDTPGGSGDSLRGSLGTFLPIPDVGVEKLTRSEANAYNEFSWFYRRQWDRVDPAVVRIRFVPAAPAPESPAAAPASPRPKEPIDRIEFAVDILPFAREPYQMLRAVLGPSLPRSMAPPHGEILSIEGEVGPLVVSTHGWVRAGVLDFAAPLHGEEPLSRIVLDPRRVPFYLILPIAERLPGGEVRAVTFTGTPEPDGFFRVEGGSFVPLLWGKEQGGRLFLSPRKEIAARLAEEIVFGEDLPAQARLRLNLDSRLHVLSAMREEAIHRVRQASLAGSTFLSNLHGILKVPIEECPLAAVRILGAGVACPGGGTFQGASFPIAGAPFFQSDRFPAVKKTQGERAEEGGECRAPLLDWLREVRISLTIDGRTLHSDITVKLRVEEPLLRP